MMHNSHLTMLCMRKWAGFGITIPFVTTAIFFFAQVHRQGKFREKENIVHLAFIS